MEHPRPAMINASSTWQYKFYFRSLLALISFRAGATLK
jgi:hypothetical protein